MTKFADKEVAIRYIRRYGGRVGYDYESDTGASIPSLFNYDDEPIAIIRDWTTSYLECGVFDQDDVIQVNTHSECDKSNISF